MTTRTDYGNWESGELLTVFPILVTAGIIRFYWVMPGKCQLSLLVDTISFYFKSVIEKYT